jgi:formate hydrogenlyase subunit 3/multisubunit Na+/H+ antiporter MnhD subunit
VIFVKGSLNALLALVAAVIGAFSLYYYIERSNDQKLFLVLGIVFILAAIALGGLFLSGRVNREEDIHITE